ncbi:hypothetical protein [Terrimonas pollutisoli]|uniref:hypothetical protein n=1 Tax=Terrimonas pollutisoli TaxID=3034147 RepID=UPI0023EE0FFC|nr:hypothetical protein [Terrimonas sp. H1YJ31]
MKRIIIPAFSISLLLCDIISQAQEEKQKERQKFEFVKQRDISKTYPASGNKLSIDNHFGNVKFVGWDKNEIKVDIHIAASSNQQDFAQKIFDAITVSDKQQGNEIQFKTIIDSKDGKNDNCKNCKSSMSIDYEVHLPVSVALSVENNFGNTEIPDYTGSVSIKNKFGNLAAGSLSNAKDIVIEFGKANIKNVSNVDATFKFSKVGIANLSGNNEIQLEFCDDTKISLDDNLSSLKMSESYSTVNLKPGNLSASYSIATSFGSVIDRSNASIRRTDTPDKYGPDSNKSYEGKSGNGSAKIEIKSSFGKIIVGEPTAEDLKDNSNKNKNKNKSKGGVVHL